MQMSMDAAFLLMLETLKAVERDGLGLEMDKRIREAITQAEGAIQL